ncbi:DUF948 domain-containing protein [Actinocatenispora sera]|uniref:DUF948 domain-containing protein n=1 Tax=Actinocatenispora sera TaxID=390989 RepID=A0A810L8D0_9ACTN|nr:DUF948 domain-containing protein [Actinocatenispora sera]BCJ30586.1 hypothetical protein Asera_46940 [Actinocatenispora sera]
MSGTELAALIAALAFLLLVGALLVPILKLRRTVDAATRALTELADRSGPILSDAQRTLDGMGSAIEQVHTSLDGVNAQLARLDVISGHLAQVSGNVAEVSTIVTGATRSPLVKAAAFGYGVRKTTAARRAGQPRSAAGRQAGRGRLVRQRSSGAAAVGRGLIKASAGRGLFRRVSGKRAAVGAGVGERDV